MFQDLRYGVRMLWQHPGFTFIAVITLALGIGANTAIFSMVEALVLRPLPFHEPERLVLLAEKGRTSGRMPISYPNFTDWRDRAQSFEGMSSVRAQFFNLTGVDRASQLRGRMVNWNFFHLLGVKPLHGRLFIPEDDRYGAARTALLSHELWQEKFGEEVTVLGKKLLLDGESYEVIGVLPPGFDYFRTDDVFVPISLFLSPQSPMIKRANAMGILPLARLKPGITLAQANSELAGIAAQLEREYPASNSGRSAQAESLQDVMSEGVRQSLWVLLGAVGFILLIACVNVANLLMVRASERQKEMAVRLALGAGRRRVIRQLLSESLLIALLGGVFGVLAGRWMLNGLLALAPANIPQLSRVNLSSTVLLFTFGLSLLTSVLCGLLPALHASHTDLYTVMKESGSSTPGRARELTRKTLLVVEVSLALVLLVGAGLLVRSMVQVLGVDPGFDPDRLLTMRIDLPRTAYDVPRRLIFHDECLARVSALPGVHGAAITLSLPIDGSQWNQGISASDKPVPRPEELPIAGFTPVSASYFETMGVRRIRGRGFTSADTAGSTRVAIINESLAHRIWHGENPIGKRLKWGPPDSNVPWVEVIGVVADVKVNGVEHATPLQAYLPFTQHPVGLQWLIVRTAGDPRQMAATVERAIHTIDQDLPVVSIRSMNQLLGSSLAQRRLILVLLVSFGVLALLLAAIGIYGVIAYTVRQRTRELGLRMALGAQPGKVLRLILSQGLRLALIGVLIGLVAAFALTRWMEALLFRVRPTDPLTFAMIAAVLLLVALCACWIPARRAAKIDPMTALRQE